MDTRLDPSECPKGGAICSDPCCGARETASETVVSRFVEQAELELQEPTIWGFAPELPVPYELTEAVTEPALEPATSTAPDDNPKTRFGLRKPAMSSVPPAALIHLMGAMADGRRKYGLMNWREKNVSSTIYYDAAMRHLMAWFDGEQTASDSKVHHLGHAMACMAIILDAEAQGTLNDDRPQAGQFSELIKLFTEEAA
jgi:hypothetical protein